MQPFINLFFPIRRSAVVVLPREFPNQPAAWQERIKKFGAVGEVTIVSVNGEAVFVALVKSLVQKLNGQLVAGLGMLAGARLACYWAAAGPERRTS